MIATLEIVGLCLVVLALLDRRAWAQVCVVCSVWFMTEWSSTIPDTEAALLYRAGFDLVAGIISLQLIRRKADAAVTGLFALMLVNHGVYLLNPRPDTANWLFYTTSTNALWIAQMVSLAVPGGVVGGRVLSDYGGRFLERRRSAFRRPKSVVATERNTHP